MRREVEAFEHEIAIIVFSYCIYKIAYEYAKSGISKDRLLDEFKQTRLQLVEILLAEHDVVTKHVTANGDKHARTLGYPIHCFTSFTNLTITIQIKC